MPLFEMPEVKKVVTQKPTTKIKLKKNETIFSLIKQAEELVNKKLSKYKDASKCITDINELKAFFENTPDNGEIRNRL